MNDCFYHYCYNGNSITHIYDSTKIDRIVSMYNFFLSEIKEIDYIFYNANKRLCFSVMGNIRMCIKQVVLYCDFRNAIKEIRRICNIIEVNNIANELGKQNLSRVQLVFNSAIIKKHIGLIYLLAKCQNIKSKGIIS